jgi:hypothetical protein
MMDFLQSIENLSYLKWVISSGSLWGYATYIFLHSIGMALVAGISAAIDLRLLGFGSQIPVKPLERLYPWMWAGFALNLYTGTILLLGDATTKVTNPDLYVKLVFVFSGIVILKIMRKKVFGDPNLDKGPLPASAKTLAWASLFCWCAAVTAGRLLAYVGPVSGLPGQSQ